MNRVMSPLDRLLIGADRGLKTLVRGSATAQRPNPASGMARDDSPAHQRRLAAGLMRVNHTGEVCAQALYQGQALTTNNPRIKDSMTSAADEEIDHLAWCEQRLAELGSHTSSLNPLFYAGSFAIGALAGAISDRVSLGFVAATEEQVCEHLREHLNTLPKEDEKSRAILRQMLEDEAAHATHALEAGGVDFPPPVKRALTLLSRVMTKTTFHL
ncbi:MAG: 2-polyprenyl-3-methyl-6-methoxy-1,4-benzoquinone monooxygenase [Spongiibacter sp.]|nr:2-polyprenyl-3-methyl-6-methoxy-1,4-benzoquinone monooxygenase [Spongiibacter sp.]